jgi:probable phosphoglycerate mutase
VAILVSPLQRAVRTAELAGLVPYEVLPDLQEWDYGAFEGRATPDIHQEVPGWSIWDGPWIGGEDAEAISARADRVVDRLLRWPAGASVAVVSHGHFLRVLAARWLGADVSAGRWLALGTATVSRLGWEHENRVIQAWNTARPA